MGPASVMLCGARARRMALRSWTRLGSVSSSRASRRPGRSSETSMARSGEAAKPKRQAGSESEGVGIRDLGFVTVSGGGGFGFGLGFDVGVSIGVGGFVELGGDDGVGLEEGDGEAGAAARFRNQG